MTITLETCATTRDQSPFYNYSRVQTQSRQNSFEFNKKDVIYSTSDSDEGSITSSANSQRSQTQEQETFFTVPLDEKPMRPMEIAECYPNKPSVLPQLKLAECAPNKFDARLHNQNLGAPLHTAKVPFDPRSFGRPRKLPESMVKNEAHVNGQRLINGEFLVCSSTPQQAFFKEKVNAEVSGDSNKKMFGCGLVSPREVYLRQSVNAEMKLRGRRNRVHEEIRSRGEVQFNKAALIDQFKAHQAMKTTLKDLKSSFQVKYNKEKANAEIQHRRKAIQFIQRNAWLLDVNHYEETIKMQLMRAPRQAFLKLSLNRELRQRAHNAREKKRLAAHEKFKKMAINSEIMRVGRRRARRQQLDSKMRHRANKKRVLEQLVNNHSPQRLKTKDLMTQICDSIPWTQGMERRLRMEVFKQKSVSLLRNQQRIPDFESVTTPAWLTHVDQQKIDAMVSFVQENSRDGHMSSSAKLTAMFRYGLTVRQYEDLIIYAKGSRRTKVHATTEPSKIPLSDVGDVFFNQFGTGYMSNTNMMRSYDIDESPGPREFFLRTLVNNMVAKRQRSSKKMWLLARHIAMPEQAYLKMKINEVIRNIGFVKERQRLRNIQRQVNQVIQQRGRKAAVNQSILLLRKTIEWRQHLSIELKQRAEKRKVLDELRSYRGRFPLRFTMSKFKVLPENEPFQLNKEIRQRALKKRLVMEIKLAGTKNRVLRQIRARGLKMELNRLRQLRGAVILKMTSLDQGNKRRQKSTPRWTQPMTRQVFLKEEVHAVFKQRGLKNECNKIIKSIGRQRMLKRGINTHIRTRALHKQLCLELQQRQQTVVHKSMIAQEIRLMGYQMRQEAMYKRQILEAKKQELVKRRGQVIIQMSSLKSVDREVQKKKVKTINDICKDRLRLLQVKPSVNKCIEQIGTARVLKSHINEIIKTHGRKSLLCREITTRGNTARNKSRVNKEIRDRMNAVMAKDRVNEEIKTRGRKHRLITELKFKSDVQLQKVKQTKKKARSPYHGMPVANQMHLKKNVGQYIKQRGLKSQLVKEVKLRFATVEKKAKLCKEILAYAKRQLWRKQVCSVIRQRALKTATMNDIVCKNYTLRNIYAKIYKKVVNSIAQRGRALEAKRVMNQEMLQRVRWMKINNRITELALRAKINFLKKQRGEVIREMGERKITKKSEPSETIRGLTQRSVNSVYAQVFAQRNRRAKVMNEIRSLRTIRENKRKVLEELKMIKARQLIGIEIKKIGAQRAAKRQVIQDIKQRGLKAKVNTAIKATVLANQRTNFLMKRQAYLKRRTIMQIQSMGKRMRMLEELRERSKQMQRRKQVDAIIQASKAKAKCCRAIVALGTQRALKKALVYEIRVRCMKNRVNQELLRYVAKKQKKAEFEWGSVEERQVQLKSHVNNAIKARRMRETVSRMLALRSRMVEAKAHVNLEIKQRGLKARCVYMINTLGLTLKRKRMVCEELKQRARFAQVVEDIRTRFFWLRPSPIPPEISPMVLFRQEIRRKKILTDIKVRGAKMKINALIKERGKVHRNKQNCNKIIRQAGLKIELNKEIRAYVKKRKAGTPLQRLKRAVIQYLDARNSRKQINKEILDRARQVYWKKQTTMIIAQGGRKLRVNRVIKDIGRQRRRKLQVLQMIRTGGMKARVCREIRQIGYVAYMKNQVCIQIKQTGFKARVNKCIAELGRTRMLKKRVNTVIKQTGLKAKVNRDIRTHNYAKLRTYVPKPAVNYDDLINSFRPRSQARAWWEMPSSSRGIGASAGAKELPAPAFSFSLSEPVWNEIPAPTPPRVRRDMIHMQLSRPTIPSGNRRSRSHHRDIRKEGDDPHIVDFPLTLENFQMDDRETWRHTMNVTGLWDDLEYPYGDAVSEKGIAVMKLVEKISTVSEAKERNERDIRLLRAKLNQYKIDFRKLNERLVQDKFALFEELEKLRSENQTLRSSGKMVNRAVSQAQEGQSSYSVIV